MIDFEKLLDKAARNLKLGYMGPYALFTSSIVSVYGQQCVSDEAMNAMFYLFCKAQPEVEAIDCHTLSKILDGSPRARSFYFIKQNIFEKAREITGAYIEGGNHWTFFHCDIGNRIITYFNSFGESSDKCKAIAREWGSFAMSRGGPAVWQVNTVKHPLQKDGISCRIHTILFAETFLKKNQFSKLKCPNLTKERARLANLLFDSLDRTKTCGLCERQLPDKDKPLDAEPGVALPLDAEPGVALPLDAEPGVALPLDAEPGVALPLDAEPGVALPLDAEPGVALPLDAEPGVALPLDAEPGVALPLDAEPGVALPLDAEPGVALPLDAEPGVALPLDAEPGVAQPLDAETSVAQPLDAEPGVALPLDAEPGVAQPPTKQNSECVDLAEDVGHLASRHIPLEEVGAALVEKSTGDVLG
ncbi:hypothetical protein DPEC_G00071510 [Dallia pectoralis]|uniref:Uncharacterized protein n=1 Tax=Dallia pectoralis TaxID=75939 RepID=A0ACC2H2M6_DALPE|nr:hypothetical protein DPEC_G00071510 [Dallia pectoralis]